MHVHSTYTITISGANADVALAIDYLASILTDQSYFQNLSCARSSNSDNEKDDIISNREESIQIDNTHSCVWIEDIEQLAIEMVLRVPTLNFSISGYVVDNTVGVGDKMDFLVQYSNKKLTSSSSAWYISINMDDFIDYESFCSKICDLYGNPRYSEEDFEFFRLCSKEWYVLDSGLGEFTTNVDLGKPVKLKLSKLR